jgi:hypothetical protein
MAATAAATDLPPIDTTGYEHIPRFRRSISKIVSFVAPYRPTVQIIMCKTPTVFDAVLLFDLDVCRIIYDGVHVLSAQGPDVKTVSITKECLDVQTPVEWKRTIVRMGKYLDRGFTADLSSAIERFTHKFSMDAAMDWNRAVLVFIGRECDFPVLKHMKLPYWTRTGNQNSIGADLVLGGKILCHIADIRPMCDCGSSVIVGSYYDRACTQCAVKGDKNVNNMCHNGLPEKFEIGDASDTTSDVAYVAEYRAYVAAITEARELKIKMHRRKYQTEFHVFENIGLFKSDSDRDRMYSTLVQCGGDMKRAYQIFVGDVDDDVETGDDE